MPFWNFIGGASAPPSPSVDASSRSAWDSGSSRYYAPFTGPVGNRIGIAPFAVDTSTPLGAAGANAIATAGKVYMKTGDSLTVIDPSDGSIITTIPNGVLSEFIVNGGQGLAVSGTNLFASFGNSNFGTFGCLVRVDTTTDTVAAATAASGSYVAISDIHVNPVNGNIYAVMRSGSPRLEVIDPATLAILQTIPLSSAGPIRLAWEPTNELYWVTHTSAFVVTRVNITGGSGLGAEVGTIADPSHRFTPIINDPVSGNMIAGEQGVLSDAIIRSWLPNGTVVGDVVPVTAASDWWWIDRNPSDGLLYMVDSTLAQMYRTGLV